MDEASNKSKNVKYKLAFNYRLLCPNGENNPPEYQFEEVRAMHYYKIYEAREKAEREKQAELEKKNLEIEELKRRLEESERIAREAQRQSASSSRTRSSGTFWNTVNDDFTNVSAFTVGYTTLKSKHDDTDINDETASVSKHAKYDFDSTKNMTINTRDANRDFQNIFGNNNNTTTIVMTNDENTMPIGEKTCQIYVDAKPKHQIGNDDQDDISLRTCDLKTFKHKSTSNRAPLQPLEVPAPQALSQASEETQQWALDDQLTTTVCFNPNAMSTVSLKPFAQQLKSGMNFNDSELNTIDTMSTKKITLKTSDDKLAKIIEEDCNTQFGWSKLAKNTGSQSDGQKMPPLSQSVINATMQQGDDLQWDDNFNDLDPKQQTDIVENDSVINKTFKFNTPAKLATQQPMENLTYNESYYCNSNKLNMVSMNYHLAHDISIGSSVPTISESKQQLDNTKPSSISYHLATDVTLNATRPLQEKSLLRAPKSLQDQSVKLTFDKTLVLEKQPTMPSISGSPFGEKTRTLDDTTVVDIEEDKDEDGQDSYEEKHDDGELLTTAKFDQTMQENIRVLSVLDPNISHQFDTINLKTLNLTTKNLQTATINLNTIGLNPSEFFNEDSNEATNLNQTIMNAIQDPFNDENRKRLLIKKNDYLSAKSNYTTLSMPKPEVNKGDSLLICSSQSYKVMKLIGEGAYAKIYLLEKKMKDGSVNKVALKVSCQSSSWEYFITEVLHDRLAELKTQIIVSNSFVHFKDFISYDNGSFSAMKYYKNGTLLDLINYHLEKKDNFPYWFVIYLTTELFTIISYLHKSRIIHGDIKPDNLMVDLLPNSLNFFDRKRTKCLVLIDFNRSIDLEMFPNETQFDAKVSNKSLLCCEMMQDKPWTFQIDYFGILACIHCIIHKKYMKIFNECGKNRIQTSIPRCFDKIFGRLFDTYLNIASCDAIPDLESEWLPQFFELFKEEIKNFKKSEKYLNDLNAYFSGDFKSSKKSL